MPTAAEVDAPTIDKDQIARGIAARGPWFHNIDLHGVKTAPNHFLGDYPQVKWRRIAPAFPPDLRGASVLDIGCNGGFYSIELKKRNAGRVLGIDVVDESLEQARFAARTLDLDIEFEKMSVYDVDALEEKFDHVLFLGLFYHLRYPLLALDKIVKKVKGQLLFQSMLRGSPEPYPTADDYGFWDMQLFSNAAFPCAYFIEKSYANDPTNWFIPNRSGAEAMLRSAGLEIVAHPESETWVCVPRHVQRDGEYILDLELSGRL